MSERLDEMSNIATHDDRAVSWAEWLEHTRARRLSATIPDARRSVARDLREAPGRLERLRAGRIKGIRAHLFEKLRVLVMSEIQLEIARLTHELEMARQSGVDPRVGPMAEIETHLAAVRGLIAGERSR